MLSGACVIAHVKCELLRLVLCILCSASPLSSTPGAGLSEQAPGCRGQQSFQHVLSIADCEAAGHETGCLAAHVILPLAAAASDGLIFWTQHLTLPDELMQLLNVLASAVQAPSSTASLRTS